MKNLGVLILLLLAANVSGQKKMTAEMLWSLGRVSIDDVSTNGDTVLYGVKYYDIEKNTGIRQLYLWVENNGSSRVTQLTNEDKSVGNGLLLPGLKVGYLKAGRWYVMGADGSESVKKSDVEGAISILKYSPDYSRVLYVKDVKVYTDMKDKYPSYKNANVLSYDKLNYMHWDHFEDDDVMHIHYSEVNKDFSFSEGKDIMEGEVFESPVQPFGGAEQINWSPDASSIAYTCKKMDGLEYVTSTNSDIYVYDIQSSITENISEGMLGYDMAPLYSPDGNSLAWLSMEEPGNEADKNNIVIRDLTNGKQMNLTKNYPETVNSFVFTPDGKNIQFLSPTKATIQFFSIAIPKKIKATGKSFYRPLTTGDHNYTSLFSRSNAIYATRQDMNSANEVYRVDMVTGKPERLSDVNRKIYQVVQGSKIEKRWIKTTDNKEMLTWVIYPPDFDPNKKYPALLYCQGGPQSTVSQFYSFRWNFQIMAANGYIVIAPNRRGLPSFGEEWNAEISLDWGGQAMRDYISAVDSIVQEPYIDENRVGAVGASYGGYSIFFLAGMHEGRFKAFISHDGVFDFGGMYGSTEELFFPNHEWGGAPWDNPQPASYTKFSPNMFVKNWDTPILIIHGMKDYRVPFSQSQYAFTAAQVLGVPSKFLIFPEENHWVLSPQNSLIWYAEFYEWLDTYLK
jgi:dipeptidyl aminopeptidase/acylaminoacyl peptidase